MESEMFDETQFKTSRRRMLLTATATLGGIGAVTTCVPFVESLSPSEAAKAAGAPVKVNISRIEPGRLMTAEWRGKPVWIFHRTDAMLLSLGKHDPMLADPESSRPQQPAYAKNSFRSIKPRYFVAIGICTHLGCIPTFRPEAGSSDLGQDWPGGFYCPCHGSKFDLAGRVFKNVPAPLNLEIPPYRYLSETLLEIGQDTPHS